MKSGSGNETILITGVAGFLGRTFARYFFEQGWDVIGIDIASPENSPYSFLKKYLSVNLPDPSFIHLLMETKPTVCVHCAGRASVSGSITQPYDDYAQGPELTFYVINCLHEIVPECKFLLLSSAAVYGNPENLPIAESCQPAPISPYGFNKWQSEIICREFNQVYGQPTASLRIFSAYGPGLRRQVVWDICRKALMDEHILLKGTGMESRDFIHALDIAHGIKFVIQASPMKGDIYNLASGAEVKISDLAKLILCSLALRNNIEFDGHIEKGDPVNWVADISKIASLGFAVEIPLEKGIESFAQWCRNELLGI
jgi:UDP-glucose 4-epimerase